MWPNNFTPRHLPKRNENLRSHKTLNTNVYSDIIHNSQKVEGTQVSISGGMEKRNVVHPYGGVLFGHVKELSPDPCYSVDEPWKYGKWEKQVMKNTYESVLMTDLE